MAPISSQSRVSVGNRDASPDRYLLKFESFSMLSAIGTNKYESTVFQSSGYKWKMIIYPDGDGSADGLDHVSVYLAVADTSTLQAGWEVNATFSFLIFDQIHGKYIVMRGIPLKGYLIKDRCVFGVDVYVIKNQGLGECVSPSNKLTAYKHKRKISKLTKVKNTVHSEEFTVGGYKWKLCLYPTGDVRHNGQSISIFLESVDAKGFDFQKRVQARFSISVKDQSSGAQSKSLDSSHWFSAAVAGWGWSAFMPLSEFKNPKKGYLVEDCCIVEADVSVIGVVDDPSATAVAVEATVVEDVKVAAVDTVEDVKEAVVVRLHIHGGVNILISSVVKAQIYFAGAPAVVVGGGTVGKRGERDGRVGLGWK
ncbi:MATH domain and coiled-coil domain-containing protein At3g58250-like [Lycium barbarum]|uniref:MATH domain and coiled-coil domain-containing protein At3g58250-like n=1 Tax=Lycium barbarum TaxID=112863 RepID=UPI00293F45F4|nr:MATH domain and coiled-coil domain-containing protein At3g58250-like [Lycium barbarum]